MITRASLEAILTRRTKRFMQLAQLDYSTVNGTNADLADPIASALRAAGYSVANRATVADSDLAAVTGDDEEKVIALAELRTLETIDTNLVSSSLTTGPVSESFRDLTRKLESLRARIITEFGIGATSVTGGSIIVSTRPIWRSGVD